MTKYNRLYLQRERHPCTIAYKDGETEWGAFTDQCRLDKVVSGMHEHGWGLAVVRLEGAPV